jgi:MFS family permease
MAALFAATQDVLVDGLAVRSLGKEERGLGNVAQVGAYRLGMVFGGAGLLVLGAKLGERWAIVALAASIAVGSAGVVLIGEPRIDPDATPADTEAKGARRRSLADEIRLTGRTLASMLHRDVRAVLAVAFFYKLGLHTASTLLKPVLVDGGWSKERIGTLAVTVGTLAGVAGSMAGGLLHKKAGDRGGLTIAAVLQALACAPLFFVPGNTDETARVTVALAVEHAASGLGTTVLFAALMGATNPRHASLQYTVLSTANALSLAVAGALGAAIADVSSPRWSFALGAALSLGSLALVPAFTGAARALHEGRELPP